MKSVSQANRIYIVLVVSYIVSQFYRVSNAVIAPEMMRSLHLTPEEMGAITGIFFLAFGLMQLPTGVLLDRIGPRYTMSSLLLVAAAGSVIFATAEGLRGLSLGRALIGVGCAAGLMGSMVAISRWFSAQQFSPLSSILFTVGGVGTLLATTPLAVLSESIGWRGAFWLMAGVTLAAAALLYSVVRDVPDDGHTRGGTSPESLIEVLRGLGAVLTNRQLWHISAIQFVCYATTLAVAGLWVGPYLNDVYQLAPLTRGYVLLALNVAILVGVVAYSRIEQWVNSRKWTIVTGAACTIGLLLVLALVPGLPLWLVTALLLAFGLTSSYVMLNHAHARAVLPDHLVGRGLTVQNLSAFLGVAVLQSASGVIVGEFADASGAAGEGAYRAVFGFLAAVVLVGLMLYLPVRDVQPKLEKNQ
jgi:sugar phosphate permease